MLPLVPGPGRLGVPGDTSYDCRVFIAAWLLLVCVGSLLLASGLEPLPAALSPTPPRPPAPVAGQAGSGGRQHLGPRRAVWSGSRARQQGSGWQAGGLPCWLWRAEAEVEASLRHLCAMLLGRAWGRTPVQLATWLLLLSFLHVTALVLELPQFSLPPQLAAGASS